MLIIFTVILSGNLSAQNQNNTAEGFDLSGSPQWVRDLRRGEIVAFGSFPFTFFFTSFSVDMYRTATHNWDMRYAPWPVKSAGAVDMTWDQQVFTIGVAAAGSIVIALVDHLIVRYNRNKIAQEIRSMPPGTPIIIRRPMYAADEGSPEPDVQDTDTETADTR